MKLHSCLAAVLLAACGSSKVAPLGPPGAAGLVVHEWGTYTSLEGSDGRSMQGLQHTEEALPSFVHTRGGSPALKGAEQLPGPVTQKLETPVLYFYGAADTAFSVHVGFPKGVISEWYPDAAGYQPPIGLLKALIAGSMDWAGTLSPLRPSSTLPSVPSDSVWAPSRTVSAMPVHVGMEQEGFIFYRGLGQFDMPLRVTSQGGALSIVNDSSDPVAAAFLLRIDGAGSAGVLSVGEIGARGSTSIGALPDLVPLATYEATAKPAVEAALVASGLTADEAHAMVETWSRSYFEMPGLRLLYVAPRSWTDGLLPISISPTPTSLVRTLVGRIEVLTEAEETAIVGQIQAAANAGQQSIPLDSFGRFAEPKLRRALELIQDQKAQALAQSMLLAASEAP
jgi:hypothetical protein